MWPLLPTLLPTLPRGSLVIFSPRILRIPGLRQAMLSILSHPHAFRCRCPGPASAYLASQPTAPLLAPGTVKTARIRFHGCPLRPARLNDDCRPHPTTVAAAPHFPHTRPPDVLARLAYQRLLMNTYRISDLCRPRARHRQFPAARRVLAITRSGAGIDLPAFGRGRSMSDREDAAPAARGGLGSRAHC